VIRIKFSAMKKFSSRTPPIAAFFLAALLLATILSGCNQEQATRSTGGQACNISTTSIASVQGSRSESDMVGEVVTVRGITTLIDPGKGIYIEEPGSDDNERTSNAMFIEVTGFGNAIQPGVQVQVEGTVAELKKGRNSLTALVNTPGLQVCGDDRKLPLTPIQLPLQGLDREALEAMRVSLPDTLTITDNYRFNNGQIGVSGNGLQYIATELMPPGAKTNKYARENQTFTLPIQLQQIDADAQSFSAGAQIDHIIGVMTHDDRELRLSVATAVKPMSVSAHMLTAPIPKAAANASRVVGMNLYNYFNGDGHGGDFPTPRGAKTVADFEKQRQRIGAALHAMQPQLVAVMELENDGFGPDSATADFVALLNQEAGGVWLAVRPENDNTGSDAIRVGLFYRSDLWQTQESARTLSGPEFNRSRQPQAQLLRPVGGGESLLLVVNHLKSKGSCPDSGPDADQKDGQGCWSAMRTVSAQKMTAWVKSLAATSQTDNILIMGDMNAYRREAPVDAIRTAGFEELMDSAEGQPFSFMYYGQAGTLDYAFVSPALKQKVQNAFIWQVNSSMPAQMDLQIPWLRFSDHDPVVVDLSLRH